jgi:hypothetical protein
MKASDHEQVARLFKDLQFTKDAWQALKYGIDFKVSVTWSDSVYPIHKIVSEYDCKMALAALLDQKLQTIQAKLTELGVKVDE